MGTQRPATSTHLCLLPARVQTEVCVTTARTTPRARTASTASYTISGIDGLALPFMRPVFVSSGFRERWLATHSPLFVSGDMKATKKE